MFIPVWPSFPSHVGGGDPALPVDEVDELEKNRLAIEELDEIDRKLAVFEEREKREKRVNIPEPSDPEAAVPAHSADDSGGVGGERTTSPLTPLKRFGLTACHQTI